MGIGAEWLEELCEELGESAASRVLSTASGMRLYVPAPEHLNKSVILSVVGHPIASWLSERYVGEYVEVPSAHARRTSSLKRVIAENPDANVNEVANAFGVTHRRVYQLRAKVLEDTKEDPPLLSYMRNPSSEK